MSDYELGKEAFIIRNFDRKAPFSGFFFFVGFALSKNRVRVDHLKYHLRLRVVGKKPIVPSLIR